MRQYARLVSEWIAGIGLDVNVFGTRSLGCKTAGKKICVSI